MYILFSMCIFFSSNKPDSDSPAIEVSSKDRSKKPEKKRRRFVEAPESSTEKPKPSVADATLPAPAAKGEATASEPVKRARTFREKPDRREPDDEPRPPEPPATTLPSAAAASEPPVCESSFGLMCSERTTR